MNAAYTLLDGLGLRPWSKTAEFFGIHRHISWTFKGSWHAVPLAYDEQL